MSLFSLGSPPLAVGDICAHCSRVMSTSPPTPTAAVSRDGRRILCLAKLREVAARKQRLWLLRHHPERLAQ